ncbi:MAG: hypothetical protein ACI9LE_000061 [Paraglaciecola sp.]|jgi:hypothetical protein
MNLNGDIFIYNDNYYGQLINTYLGKKVACFLDVSPSRDNSCGKPILPVDHLKKQNVHRSVPLS